LTSQTIKSPIKAKNWAVCVGSYPPADRNPATNKTVNVSLNGFKAKTKLLKWAQRTSTKSIHRRCAPRIPNWIDPLHLQLFFVAVPKNVCKPFLSCKFIMQHFIINQSLFTKFDWSLENGFLGHATICINHF